MQDISNSNLLKYDQYFQRCQQLSGRTIKQFPLHSAFAGVTCAWLEADDFLDFLGQQTSLFVQCLRQ